VKQKNFLLSLYLSFVHLKLFALQVLKFEFCQNSQIKLG